MENHRHMVRVNRQQEVAGVDDNALMERASLIVWEEFGQALPGEDLAKDAYIGFIWPQHMAGMDDLNANVTAHRGEPVDALKDSVSVSGVLDETVLHVHVDKRQTLRNHWEVRHRFSSAPLPE